MISIPRHRVAVVPLFDPDMTPSGLLHIPDQAKERCDQGIVKYIGAEVDPEIKIGDHVLFSGYTGTFVRLEGEDMMIILVDEFITCKIHAADTDIPGLFFQDVEGDYFTATYEMVMNLVAQGIRETKWFQTIDAKKHLPDPKDYEKWR